MILQHSSALHRNALKLSLQKLGAMVTDIPTAPALLKADAILTDARRETVLERAGNVPLLRLVTGAGVIEAGLESGGRNLELTCPLRRQDLRELAAALTSGDFQYFDGKEKSAASRANLPEFRGLKALVVDDNPVNREVLQEALLNMGAAVSLAHDGKDALEKMGAHKFDIVFMDCSMPVMDGFAAARQWRASESGPRLPIIALTAYIEGASGDDWVKAGMDFYLIKPFTIPSIADTIARFVPESLSGMARVFNAASPSETGGSAGHLQTPLLDSRTVAMISKLSARGGGKAARRIFGLFTEHAPAGLESVIQAVKEGRPDTTAAMAHALKSMASSAGALRLSRAADEVELLAAGHREIGADLLAGLSLAMSDSIKAFGALMAQNAPDTAEAEPDKSAA